MEVLVELVALAGSGILALLVGKWSLAGVLALTFRPGTGAPAQVRKPARA